MKNECEYLYIWNVLIPSLTYLSLSIFIIHWWKKNVHYFCLRHSRRSSIQPLHPHPTSQPRQNKEDTTSEREIKTNRTNVLLPSPPTRHHTYSSIYDKVTERNPSPRKASISPCSPRVGWAQAHKENKLLLVHVGAAALKIHTLQNAELSGEKQVILL